jgi:hypothetical protein
MTRIEIINAIIQKNNYKTYLEIGVNTPAQPGYSHDSINIPTKHGVDPNVDTTFKMTSDDFFAQNKNMYDIIFVDGLHIFDQAYRDIVNSLRFLNVRGTIIVHDCNPMKEVTQRRKQPTGFWVRIWHGIRHGVWHGVWHGDVWKAILKLRIENPNIQIYTIDADEGCAIIQKGSQELYKPDTNRDPFTFDFLNENREKILNLVSVETWKRKLGNSL